MLRNVGITTKRPVTMFTGPLGILFKGDESMIIQCKVEGLEKIGRIISYKKKISNIRYRNFVRKQSRKHK